MTIQVRVLSAQALAQLKALEAQQVKVAASTRAVGTASAWGIPYMAKWGSQVQWMGRQLTYNFAIPIALAMGLATKFALDNERALVRVTKVYGDGSKVFRQLSKTEIPALSRAFEQLSNQFAVHQDEVISIAGDWAAVGASGVALAKAVKLTLETMVLGELNAADATRALIAIQAQYGMNTKQLTKTIDILNMVENQTGATMGDLIEAMSRVSGTAKTAGIDVEHLSAMFAALIPATGSAASAGNGLKTMISRLLSPTNDAVEVMKAMGIAVHEAAWESLNGTQRLEAMATAYGNLNDVQKIHVSTLVASRWQLNRFSTLMDAVNNQNSYYYKALKSTSDRTAIFKQRQYELNQVLSSSPQKLEQTWNIMRNAMADVIVPIIPLIVYVAQVIARMGHAFAGINPEIQKLVLAFGAFIIVFAIGMRLLGATMTLISAVAATVHIFGAAFMWVMSTVLWPFTATLGLVGKALWGFAAITLKAMTFVASTVIRYMMIAVGAMVEAAVAMAGATIWGPIVAMAEAAWLMIAGLFSGGASIALTIFLTWLGEMWAGFAIWRAGMLTALAGWAFQVGTLFTLLGSFMAEALATLWAWMTVPGMLSGYILGIWTTLMGAMASIWASTQVLLLRLWTAMNSALIAISVAMSRGLAGVWAAMGFLWNTVLVNMRFLWAAMWATMEAITAFSVTVIGGIIAVLPEIAAAVGAAVMVALTSPWTYAIAAILGLAYHFRDDLVNIFNDAIHGIQAATLGPLQKVGGWFADLGQLISDVFWSLPDAVTGAMIAVLTVIRDAALKIYEWMSYLNPFARHSPSLVESVKAGMDLIENQYGRAAGLGGVFAAAAADLAKFKNMMPKGGEFNSERADVAKNIPKALPLFDKLTGHLKDLNAILKRQEAAVNAQQAVVDRWKAALDRANAVLDRQQDKLDKMQGRLTHLKDQYEAAATAIQNFASSPLQGMKAMSDAMFDNEIAQKKLQLQMMQWEDVNGSIDDMRDRLGLLQGDIETLTGRAESLRQQGAGSDVLGPIQDQIAALEAQADATRNAIQDSPVDAMQKQLEEMQRQGQMLQLQYDINYDPLTRSIQAMANAQKELSYDEVVAGIQQQQAVMAQLQPQIDAQTAAVAGQQAYVDQLTAARDVLQASYDRESKTLDHLNDQYSKTKDAISEIETALRDMASAANQAGAAADEAKKKGAGAGGGAGELSGALQTFNAGKGLDFPDVGGKNAIGREGGLEDQSALIDQFTQQSLDEMTSIMGGFDMLGPLKKVWNKAWGWVVDNLGPVGEKIVSGVDKVFQSLGGAIDGAGGSGFVKSIGGIVDVIIDMGKSIGNLLGSLWDAVGPDIIKIGKALQKFLVDIWTQLAPELAKFGPIFSDLGKAFTNIWNAIKPFVQILGVALVFALKLVASVIADVLGPTFNAIIGILKYFIIFVRGVFEVIIGLLSGDWALAWQGAKDIVVGALGLIWEVIKGAFLMIWGFIWGILQGIVGFFQWLYDEIVGHSIIPDLVKDIWGWIKKLGELGVWIWNNALKPAWEFFKQAWEWIRDEVKEWWPRIKALWNTLVTAGQWIWDNVVSPIYNRFVTGWGNIRDEVKEWWGRIKGLWSGFTEVGQWFKDNVTDKIFNRVTGVWGDIKQWFLDNKNLLTDPVKGIVNTVIGAVNTIIGGLNKVADVLPGIDWEIKTIPELAQGGPVPRRRVGNGFVTNGARAIVGEGKPNYPEFVIPTDPTYRNRARSLLAAAAEKLNGSSGAGNRLRRGAPIGEHGVPMYGIGGILHDAYEGVKNQVADLAKDAAGTVMNPLLNAAHDKVDNLWTPVKVPPLFAIDKIRSWVDATDKATNEAIKAYSIPAGGNVSVPTPANPAGRTTYKGGTFTNLFVAHLKAAEGLAKVGLSVIQGGFRPTTDYSGTSHHGDALDSQVNNALIVALRRVGVASGDRTGLGDWAPHVHSVPGPKTGYGAGSAPWQFSDYIARGGMKQPLNSPWGLSGGGIVQATTGGVLALLGEGGQDEAVTPLPRNWRTDAFGGTDSKGDTTINIYGSLEFPNITSGGDAKTFIDNLEDLAG